MTGAGVDLSGRTAVVTGGGRGIGLAIAEALAGAGASVIVAARSEHAVRGVAAELRRRGSRAWGIVCDVTDGRAVARLAEEAAAAAGRVEIVVNNAGVAHAAPLAKTTEQMWRAVLDVNATGTFLCTQAFLPPIVEAGWGRVINVASTAGLVGGAYISAYAAAKHAVIGFTRSVADEVAGTGVTVNALCPGYVDTSMTAAAVRRVAETTGRSEAEALASILAAAGQARLVAPSEVAVQVVRLCGDDACDMNGEAIVIDGGGVPE